MWEKIPFKHIAIVIFILVVAWILMSITYPAPANGQNIAPPNSKALAIQQGIIEQFGAEPAFERYGTVSENPALVEKSLSLSEGFYVVIGEKPVSFTPALLFEQGIINPDRWQLGDWRLNASNLLNNVRPDWIVYQYYWNGLESVVFISPGGRYQTIGYEVDFFVGQINLQFFQINVGKPLGGVLNSRLVCETGVTLEMVPNSQR